MWLNAQLLSQIYTHVYIRRMSFMIKLYTHNARTRRTIHFNPSEILFPPSSPLYVRHICVCGKALRESPFKHNGKTGGGAVRPSGAVINFDNIYIGQNYLLYRKNVCVLCAVQYNTRGKWNHYRNTYTHTCVCNYDEVTSDVHQKCVYIHIIGNGSRIYIYIRQACI